MKNTIIIILISFLSSLSFAQSGLGGAPFSLEVKQQETMAKLIDLVGEDQINYAVGEYGLLVQDGKFEDFGGYEVNTIPKDAYYRLRSLMYRSDIILNGAVINTDEEFYQGSDSFPLNQLIKDLMEKEKESEDRDLDFDFNIDPDELKAAILSLNNQEIDYQGADSLMQLIYSSEYEINNDDNSGWIDPENFTNVTSIDRGALSRTWPGSELVNAVEDSGQSLMSSYFIKSNIEGMRLGKVTIIDNGGEEVHAAYEPLGFKNFDIDLTVFLEEEDQ